MFPVFHVNNKKLDSIYQKEIMIDDNVQLRNLVELREQRTLFVRLPLSQKQKQRIFRYFSFYRKINFGMRAYYLIL